MKKQAPLQINCNIINDENLTKPLEIHIHQAPKSLKNLWMQGFWFSFGAACFIGALLLGVDLYKYFHIWLMRF